MSDEPGPEHEKKKSSITDRFLFPRSKIAMVITSGEMPSITTCATAHLKRFLIVWERKPTGRGDPASET
jgi:hypothetical protein